MQGREGKAGNTLRVSETSSVIWRGAPSGDSMEADLELMLLEGRPKGQGSRRPREKELET